MKAKPVIQGLQFIRLLAFICIFLSHSIGKLDIIGAAGVSVFIIMSGFLMVYNYLYIEICTNPFSFAFKKIWPLYPLHIFCMVLVLTKPVMAMIINHSFSGLFDNIKYLVCNVFLIQAWIPNISYYYSLNAVSWYLCLCVFFYFLFPVIIRLFRKIVTKRAICFFINTYHNPRDSYLCNVTLFCIG